MKNEKVIDYDSRLRKLHERKYPIYDLELEAMVFSFKIPRHYLYGVHVDLYTNHKSLQYTYPRGVESLTKKVVGIVERL